MPIITKLDVADVESAPQPGAAPLLFAVLCQQSDVASCARECSMTGVDVVYVYRNNRDKSTVDPRLSERFGTGPFTDK